MAASAVEKKTAVEVKKNLLFVQTFLLILAARGRQIFVRNSEFSPGYDDWSLVRFWLVWLLQTTIDLCNSLSY